MPAAARKRRKPPSATTRERRARRAAKRAERRDPAFVAWAHATQPCAVCGSAGTEAWPNEFHHFPYRSKVGEWSDRKGFILCKAHHQGAAGFHRLHREGFERLYCVNVDDIIRRYNEAYERARDCEPLF